MLLNYQSQVAKTLFTEHYAKNATPQWQQELMGMTMGEKGGNDPLDEAKGEYGDYPVEPLVTVVSMHGLAGGLGNVTFKHHNQTKTLIDCIWEASDAGQIELLKALLKQVGDGPKARHFNVVGGAEHFNLNNLHHLSEKFPNSPLYVAAKKGHPECVQLLLEAGADSEYKDKFGMTAMHVAAIWGRLKCLRKLVEFGADINSRDNEGNTPIHAASIKYVKNSIAVLVELGCNITIKNNAKCNPMEATKYVGARNAVKRSLTKRGW
jgi:ankyrin repeat protein